MGDRDIRLACGPWGRVLAALGVVLLFVALVLGSLVGLAFRLFDLVWAAARWIVAQILWGSGLGRP